MCIMVNVQGKKHVRTGPHTSLRCVKDKCVWNDSGCCFFPGEVSIGIECSCYTEEKPEPKMPKDCEEPPCSSGIRCWVTASFFAKTLEGVIKKKNAYYKKYPPEGYSTNDPFVSFLREDGFWQGVVRRYSTCD